MPARILVFFLALVLFWSGLATHESSVVVASATAEQVDVAPPVSADDGSVADHHLDDQPVQSQAETAADLQALMTNSVATLGRAPASAAAWPACTGALPAPCLDGPRRPPRTALVTA